MLPKACRLKKKKDFERVFEKGKGFKEDFLYLKITKNNLKNSRFGFVVGKNFSSKAALRNKTKRQLRELARARLRFIKKGFDIVVVASPGLKINDFWELEAVMAKLLRKSGLLR